MPVIKDVKWGEDNTLDAAPTLTEEELHSLKERMQALDKILAQEQKAKYKIELLFGSARTMRDPTPGAISFWESGSKLNGGGDAKMYICGGKQSGKSSCEAFIPDSSNGYGYLVCPDCKEVWQGNQVTGEFLARLTMQGWAKLIHKFFVRLGHNADIYVKHARDDIRSRALAEQAAQKGGELLAKSRTDRAIYIYPLKNIIKDTSHGSDPLTQFYKLLKA